VLLVGARDSDGSMAGSCWWAHRPCVTRSDAFRKVMIGSPPKNRKYEVS
jgi:hypothetical protein